MESLRRTDEHANDQKQKGANESVQRYISVEVAREILLTSRKAEVIIIHLHTFVISCLW